MEVPESRVVPVLLCATAYHATLTVRHRLYRATTYRAMALEMWRWRRRTAGSRPNTIPTV